MAVIETIDLTKNYGKTRGIANMNLSVSSGEFFGFIGPNGAGKSTTIRALLGLIAPSSGTARLFGKDVSKGRCDFLSQVGYMPSEAMFYSSMKVKDVIKLSADLRKMDCHAEASRLCERLQLDCSKKIDQLSLGNRKKVSIVCAAQHNPELYILDEPTSGLDPLMQQEFFTILREKNADGSTIFLSSHTLSEIQRNCAKTAIIKDGQIIACDSVDHLSQTSAKKVMLRGITHVPQGIQAKLVTSDSGSVVFLYEGDIHELLSAIQKLPITDITISELDLEEIFLHYYKTEDQKQ